MNAHADSGSVHGDPEYTSGEEHADALFDAVSESLRDHRDTRATKAELRASLVHADAKFQELHDWIVAGNPLPEPWRAAHLPYPMSNGVGPHEPPRG